MQTAFLCARAQCVTCLCLTMTAFAPSVVAAADFKIGDADASITGLVTIGQTRRESSQDPTLIYAPNGNAVGVHGTALGGANSDDSNLNYNRGDPVSTVLKGFVDFSIKKDQWGGLLRVKGWYDYTLKNTDVPWGNLPDGLVGGRPLSDVGFQQRAKFAGIVLQDAYLYDTFSLADHSLYVKLGNQTIPWGQRVAIGGGLSAIMPFDTPAALRPGAAAQEVYVPVPAAFARLALGSGFNLAGYYQVRFRAGAVPGCGTFGALADYSAEGCNDVMTGAVAGVATPTDRQRLAAGAVLGRQTTVTPTNAGLLGIGATYQADLISTLFGAYFSQYDNTTVMSPDVVKTTRTVGAAFITGNADGKNGTYHMEYPGHVRVFALNFETRLGGWTPYGEVSYRPNQPVSLNAGDLLAAVVATTPGILRAQMNSLPPGGVLTGFDRLKTGQAQIGLTGELPGILGSVSSTVGAEIALKHVFDLPDVNDRRYGRSDIFGTGPFNGACTPNTIDPTKQCTNYGYVTKFAWGYRTSAALNYINVLPEFNMSPRLVYSADQRGWSYDGIFNEGRRTISIVLPTVYRKVYSATLSYTGVWGGRYVLNKDRDAVALNLGVAF